MIKLLLINLVLYLSYIWNSVYFLINYLKTDTQELIDKKQYKQLKQILQLPTTLPTILHKSFDAILTILNWNIHYFTDYQNNCTFIKQFDYLKEKQPDIICLQEVKCKTFEINNKKCNQLKCIAEKLGYYHIHINELAVLSKYKILHHKFISHYPNSNSFGNRSILFHIKVNNKIITILNLHLNNDLFGMEQLSFYYKYLKKLIQKYNESKQILIICGDFNSIPLHPIISKLKHRLQIANPEYDNYPHTFPTNYPILQLDKCYSNEFIINDLELLDSTPDTTCILSDHFPLINSFLIK
tara:strand:- start:1396 stop:2289 length:894 start_codon:yes stop_codon:yes gene_type:complete